MLLFLFVLRCNENMYSFAGKMSNIRADRKRQQLNNLVAMVTQLARPGYTVVDFCSGTVRVLIHQCSFACIFITAPNHGYIRLQLNYQQSEKGTRSYIRSYFFPSLNILLLTSECRQTGNYPHENACSVW